MRHSNGAVFTLSSAMPAKSGTIAFRYQTVTIYSDISIRTGSGTGRPSLRYRDDRMPECSVFRHKKKLRTKVNKMVLNHHGNAILR